MTIKDFIGQRQHSPLRALPFGYVREMFEHESEHVGYFPQLQCVELLVSYLLVSKRVMLLWHASWLFVCRCDTSSHELMQISRHEWNVQTPLYVPKQDHTRSTTVYIYI